MPRTVPSATAMRVASLSQSADNSFSIIPERDALEEMAATLDLSALRKLRFEGRLVAQGGRDWRLEGHLGATVVQPCVVTLDPVTTRIETEVIRKYQEHFEEPQELEVEMPEDETVEPLGSWIDPGQVLMEALALSLPDFPRKDGAELGQMNHTEPGKTPMTDEDAKPFAGLAALRGAMDKGEQ